MFYLQNFHRNEFFFGLHTYTVHQELENKIGNVFLVFYNLDREPLDTLMGLNVI